MLRVLFCSVAHWRLPLAFFIFNLFYFLSQCIVVVLLSIKILYMQCEAVTVQDVFYFFLFLVCFGCFGQLFISVVSGYLTGKL